MTHKFDTEIAKKVGILGAVLYDNIEWWCMKNKATDTNEYEGEFWTYNSNRGWAELFDYVTVNQIKLALKKLEDAELIVTGVYNKVSYDRTKWYRPISLFHQTEKSNETDRNVQPIPSNKPSNKQDSRKTHKFIAPTIEEISEYIKEKNLNIEAKQFFDYFEAGNWIDVKGNKVKNWKQKLLTWNSHNKQQVKASTTSPYL